MNEISVGRKVFVPREVWPTEKPPAGKKGWEGVVSSRKGRQDAYYIAFPGDPAKYWFSGSDVSKWLLPEESASSASTAKHSAKRSPAKAAPAKPKAAASPAKLATKASTPAKPKAPPPIEAAGSSGGKPAPNQLKRSAGEGIQSSKNATGLKPLPPKPRAAGSTSLPKRARMDSGDKAVYLEQLNTVVDQLSSADVAVLVQEAKRLADTGKR